MIYDIIPVVDEAMSRYSLITFIIFAVILLFIWRYINSRFSDQKACSDRGGALMDELQKTINELKVDIAIVRTSIADIEDDAKETRRAISDINKILIAKFK